VRAAEVDVPLPLTLQEARIWNWSERVGAAVRDLVYTNTISRLRGIQPALSTRDFMRLEMVLSPEQIMRFIEAPRRPLIGHTDMPTIEFFCPDGVRFVAGRDGVITRESDGEVVTLKPAAPPSAHHPIRSEDAWWVVGDLLATAHPLYDSLGPKRREQTKEQIEALTELAPALRIVARKMVKALPVATLEVVALEELAKTFSPDIDRLARSLKGRTKPTSGALRSIVVALRQAFQRLYGCGATGRAEPDESPFVLFAAAFLRELGCPYAAASIQDAHYRHGPRARKKSRPVSRSGVGRS
jgi:hypothetical protein